MYSMQTLLFCALLSPFTVTEAQVHIANVQNNTFNSSYHIPAPLVKASGINSTLEHNVNVALNFERSNWVNGSITDESFYTVPADKASATAGTLLKVQLDANTSAYSLPPNTALSRILFQSENLNGTVVPASAYVLWPYLGREGDDGFQMVAFAHGACGIFGNYAPSHLRTLWYHWEVPFELAVQGYVVVAPDYQGLGVQASADGKPVVNTFLSNPSEANDLFYAVQAARQAFPSLGKRFVTMGHSQGGGAAWASAQRQALKPIPGYLGTVAISPLTNFLKQNFYNAKPPADNASSTALLLTPSLQSIFPDFDISSILRKEGIRRLNLFKEIQGCNAVASQLFPSSDVLDLVKADWVENYFVKSLANITSNGNKTVSGPMLIIQGTDDPAVPEPLTSATVRGTCLANPDTAIDYYTFEGVGHTPVCYASRQIYLQWLADRFGGTQATKGCNIIKKQSIVPYERYQYETNFFIEYAAESYELA